MNGPSTILQRLLFPSTDICTDGHLYLRCTGDAWYSMAEGFIELKAGSSIRFDTYFNALSVGKWRRHTKVRTVIPFLEVLGSLEVHAILNHPYRAARVVWATKIDCNVRQIKSLPQLDLDSLGEGQLYLEIRCKGSAGAVFGGGFSTSDPVANPVKLGAVMTTFNRPDYVSRNISRIAQAMKEVDAYADRLEILVVDNAANLDLELPAWVPVTVVPNKNLGGAGGFARGLMHFRASPGTTHVLFMDDDITFDPEVIFRTIEFLSFASDDEMCLAGAMLTEEQPHIQFESGATFRSESVHPFRPIGGQVDLRDWRNLVKNDLERSTGYGAWWYFAFPIHLTNANPLPLFIRGDDVCFGLRYTGRHTVTLNGIGVWHQQFALKNGPWAFYYESRNLPLVSSLTSDRYSSVHLAHRFLYYGIRMLLVLKYDTAAAHILGMRHFLEGPQAWLARDHVMTNQSVSQHTGERAAHLGTTELTVEAFRPNRKLFIKVGGFLSGILLSGHVLPSWLSRRKPVSVPFSGWSLASVIGREEVVYRYDPTGEGYRAKRDRARFFSLMREMFATAFQIILRFKGLKRAYREAYPEMTGDNYWRRQLGNP